MCVKAQGGETVWFYAVINNADYRGRVAQVTATYTVGGTYTLYLNVK